MPAKHHVQRRYLRIHENKLRIVPQNFGQSIANLAERPDVMYEQQKYDQADGEIRSWGLTFQYETEALAKLEERRKRKRRLQLSTATGTRGILLPSRLDNSPNFPLDESQNDENS